MRLWRVGFQVVGGGRAWGGRAGAGGGRHARCELDAVIAGSAPSLLSAVRSRASQSTLGMCGLHQPVVVTTSCVGSASLASCSLQAGGSNQASPPR